MINPIFDWCVHFLATLAGQLGMTYKAINVWVFVILWPIFTLFLIGLVVAQHQKIRRLLKDVEEMQKKKGSSQNSD